MKRAWIFLIATVLLLCVFAVASADNNGWTKEGTHLCYYENDTKVTGSQTIDGNVYFFTAEGNLKGNGKVQQAGGEYYYLDSSNNLKFKWQTVSGKKYYFIPDLGIALKTCCYNNSLEDSLGSYNDNRPDWEWYSSWKIGKDWYVFNDEGVLMINQWTNNYFGNSEGKALTGYQKVGDLYYLFNQYGLSLSGFQEVNGKIHYFSEEWSLSGQPEVRGWNRINWNWYYFDASTGIMKTGSFKMNNQQYQCNADGTLNAKDKTLLYISDSVHCINEDGDYYENELMTIDGETYYFTANGKAETGPCKLDGVYYFFDEQGRMLTGWHKYNIDYWNENERWYYHAADGKRLDGFQTINGYTYYLNYDEGMVTGSFSVRNTELSCNDYYYFDSEGKMQTGWQKYKVLYDDGNEHWYYHDSDGKRLDGFQKINGSTYYLNYNGGMVTGSFSIWNEEMSCDDYYFFDSEGKMQTGVQTVDGNKYFYGSDGKRTSGWQQVGDDKYYFEPSAATGIHWIDEECYYFDSEGIMQTGWQKDGSERWFYYATDGKRLDGWQIIDGSTYYLNGDNGMVTGVYRYTINDYIYSYYFNSEGKMQTGWQKYKLNAEDDVEKWYYHDSDGRMLFGLQTIDGSTYYLEGTSINGGYRVTGFALVGNDYYYFDEEGKMQTGWLKYMRYNGYKEEYWYYHDSDGKALFGWQTIDGETYYIDKYKGRYQDGVFRLEKDGKYAEYQFDADGKLIAKKTESIYTTGWYERDAGVWMYGDSDEYALTGFQTIDGTLYYFNDEGILQTGWFTVDDKWYFADSSGALYCGGWKSANGTWYYFRSNGEMATGWVNDGGLYYYMNSDGTMATGWIVDNDNWYFISNSGTLYTGWLKSGDSWYLFGPSGAMVTGWVVDGGTWYYFLDSGAMATDWQLIDGQWEMFGTNGAWLYSWDGN